MSTVAYLRCSTDAQDAQRQREAITALGIPVAQWFEDHESRDKAEKRPAFQNLLRAVRARQVDTIIVAALDRFGVKDAWELGKFFSLLKEHGCRLLDATGKQLNADDDATVIMSTVGALTSSREQREKAGRVISGKVTKIRAGATFQGGKPPYGLDVVCLGPDCEKWWVVYEGHDRRIKIYRDGRQERFDGPRNRPAKELHDVLCLRPSLVQERLETVAKVFRWFADESISPGQIAARLNELGVSPVYGPQWHRGVVRYLLENPVYLGLPTWNKAGNSRFMEFTAGQVQGVNGRKTGRKRDESDLVSLEQPEFPPLVDQETWERVQAKLAKSKARDRAPRRASRTAELWLRGLVVCGKCGRPMRAYAGSERNCQPPGYSCATYMRWGAKNPTGCKQHHIPHDVLENLVLDYLTETAPQVSSLLQATEADSLHDAKPLITALAQTDNRLGGVWLDMLAFVEEHLPDQHLPNEACPESPTRRIETTYGLVYEKVKPELERRIEHKEAELEALLDGFAGLSPQLKHRANRRGEAIQQEIDALRQELADLRVPWENLKAELLARKEALARTLDTLNREGHHRQKAGTLRSAIGQIICHFKPKGRGAQLESVDIIAAEDGAIRPLNFPGMTLQTDSRLGALARYLLLYGTSRRHG